MGMAETQVPPKSWRIRLRRYGRRLARWRMKGFGFRLQRYVVWVIVVFYGLLFVFIVYSGIVSGQYRLDWNTIISIFIADLPVGVILWVILERRQSKTRRILDAMGIVEAPTRYNHLELHYVDEYEDGIYSEILYFIVNTKTGQAFWVDSDVQELIESRTIRKHPRYGTKAELNRNFDHQGYKLAGRFPEGDDLFRESRAEP